MKLNLYKLVDSKKQEKVPTMLTFLGFLCQAEIVVMTDSVVFTPAYIINKKLMGATNFLRKFTLK